MAHRRPTKLLAAFLLALATLVAYTPVVRNGFVDYDDDVYVSANPHVQHGVGGKPVLWAFSTFHAGNWHPLTWLSHMLDWRLFGANAAGHHATSLLLHLVCALVLFLVLERASGALGRSAFAAALFAVHPLHVESVAWIAERKDVLCTLFWFLALGAYVRYAAAPRPGRYIPVVALHALALASKPMAVTLPVTLLLLDIWPLGRLRLSREGADRSPLTWGKAIAEKAPLFALSAASAAVTIAAQHAGRAFGSMTDYPLGARLGNAVVTTAAYLGKTLWPSDLAVFYPHPGTSLPAWKIAGAAALLLAVSAAAVRLRGGRPYLLSGWLWYLSTLVPVIGLVQVGDQAMADRYTYVPLVGIFVIVAWGGAGALAALARRAAPGDGTASLRVRRALVGVPAVAAVAALGVVTRLQVPVWRDAEALFGHALVVTRDNPVAHVNLGVLRGRQGRLDEALAHLREALRVAPHDPVARANLGTALHGLGRTDEAIREFEASLSVVPQQAGVQANLGIVLLESGRTSQAIKHLREAVRLDPELGVARAKLSVALASAGDYAGAWREVRAARRLGLEPPQAFLRELSAAMPEPAD